MNVYILSWTRYYRVIDPIVFTNRCLLWHLPCDIIKLIFSLEYCVAANHFAAEEPSDFSTKKVLWSVEKHRWTICSLLRHPTKPIGTQTTTPQSDGMHTSLSLLEYLHMWTCIAAQDAKREQHWDIFSSATCIVNKVQSIVCWYLCTLCFFFANCVMLSSFKRSE